MGNGHQRAFNRAPKRPVDKEVINVTKAAVGNTQLATVLRTAEMAETLSGIRGNMSVLFGAATGLLVMAIVLVRNGQTASTLNLTDGGTTYAPQQDVLWAAGVEIGTSGAGAPLNLQIEVKSMRKMREGDAIHFLVLSNGTDRADIHGIISSFYKQ